MDFFTEKFCIIFFGEKPTKSLSCLLAESYFPLEKIVVLIFLLFSEVNNFCISENVLRNLGQPKNNDRQEINVAVFLSID